MFRKLFITYIIIIVFITMFTNIFSVFLCIAVGLIFAYMFAKKFTAPIDELTEAANELSRGNYDKRIHIDSDEQICELAETFNKMSRELKYTIIELNDKNSKMESILNSMLNGVIAVDYECRILLINPNCYNLFEIEGNAEQKFLHDVIRNNDIFELINKTIDENKNITAEIEINKRDNLILRVYTSIIKSANSNFGIEDIGVLLVFQDITKLHKLEQMRTDFVSNVTHELKTPLTSIKGFADTLKNGAIEDREVSLKFLDIIDIEADRLTRLIQDILILSEIETIENEKHIYLNNLIEIINHVIEMLKNKAEQKEIKIITDFENDLLAFMCNKDRISQMIINLVDNAIKYTEKGNIFISCKKENKFIKIIISDTGIGIPKENLERIFERFYRVDKGRSRKMGGTGLGLSIVKHIVNLYKGNIRVESSLGKGTKFIILLPSTQ